MNGRSPLRWVIGVLPGAGTVEPRLAGEGASRRSVLGAGRVSVWTRGIVGASIFAGGLYIYSVVQGLATPDTTSAIALDASIPFVPAMMPMYLLFFPFVVVSAFVAEYARFRQIVLAGIVAAAIGWTCFLVFPASLDRPDPASVHGPVLRGLFVWLHGIDASHNTFPSLHVAITWIACLGFRETRWFLPALGVAGLICASTLFVKQHALLDVLGGSVVATASVGLGAVATAVFGSSGDRRKLHVWTATTSSTKRR
jgi:membrane-associated phospholipid phosphatase